MGRLRHDCKHPVSLRYRDWSILADPDRLCWHCFPRCHAATGQSRLQDGDAVPDAFGDAVAVEYAVSKRYSVIIQLIWHLPISNVIGYVVGVYVCYNYAVEHTHEYLDVVNHAVEHANSHDDANCSAARV